MSHKYYSRALNCPGSCGVWTSHWTTSHQWESGGAVPAEEARKHQLFLFHPTRMITHLTICLRQHQMPPRSFESFFQWCTNHNIVAFTIWTSTLIDWFFFKNASKPAAQNNSFSWPAFFHCNADRLNLPPNFLKKYAFAVQTLDVLMCWTSGRAPPPGKPSHQPPTFTAG